MTISRSVLQTGWQWGQQIVRRDRRAVSFALDRCALQEVNEDTNGDCELRFTTSLTMRGRTQSTRIDYSAAYVIAHRGGFEGHGFTSRSAAATTCAPSDSRVHAAGGGPTVDENLPTAGVGRTSPVIRSCDGAGRERRVLSMAAIVNRVGSHRKQAKEAALQMRRNDPAEIGTASIHRSRCLTRTRRRILDRQHEQEDT